MGNSAGISEAEPGVYRTPFILISLDVDLAASEDTPPVAGNAEIKRFFRVERSQKKT